MGGVPKQRHTKSRRNKRRSQIRLKAPILSICSHCQKSVLPHIACPACGYYKGREIFNPLKKIDKKRKEAEKKQKPEETEKPVD